MIEVEGSRDSYDANEPTLVESSGDGATSLFRRLFEVRNFKSVTVKKFKNAPFDLNFF